MLQVLLEFINIIPSNTAFKRSNFKDRQKFLQHFKTGNVESLDMTSVMNIANSFWSHFATVAAHISGMPRNEDMIRGGKCSANVCLFYARAWGEGKGGGQCQLSIPAGEPVKGIVSLSSCQPL